MTASIAAGKVQILIGADSQDWTAAYVAFSANDPERDDSGKLPFSGTLTLAVLAGPPDSMDPLSSAGKLRWARGQRVIINYEKSTGVYARHPRGWWYIATPPLPPTYDNPFLELELVCGMQLQTFPQPRGGQLEFTPEFAAPRHPPTNSLSRGEAIQQCLTKSGLTLPWVGTVPKHPLASQITKDDPEGYTELAGQLAYGGCALLYQNNQGQITAQSGALAATAPLLTVDVDNTGQVVSFEPTAGGELPAEEVIFTGTFTYEITTSTSEATASTREERGDGSALDPALLGSEIVMRRISRSETTGAGFRLITERVEAPLGLVAPEAFPKEAGLGLDEEYSTSYNYSGGGGKLSSITKRTKGLFAKVCANTWKSLKKADQQALAGNIVEIIDTTSYTYNGDVVESIQRRVTEPIGAIDLEATATAPTAPIVTLQQNRFWSSSRQREWAYSQLTRIPAARLRSDIGKSLKDNASRIAVRTALVSDPNNTFTDVSNSGQTTPPNAERQATESEEKEIPLKGTCRLSLAPSPFTPRERRYSLDVAATSDAQLAELAQIEAALLLGRNQGATIQLPLLDVFVDNPAPLFNIAVLKTEILPTGRRKNLYLYQANGVSFDHEADQAVLTANLIWLGTQEGALVPHTATPTAPVFVPAEVAPPYTAIRLEATQAISIQPSTPAVTIPTGNFVQVIQPTTFGWGWGFEATTKTKAPTVQQSTFGWGWGWNTKNLGITHFGWGWGWENRPVAPRAPIAPTVSTFGWGWGIVGGFKPAARPVELGWGWGFEASRLAITTHTFSSGGDTNGLFYAYGTNFGTESWQNPHTAGRITVSAAPGSYGPTGLVDRTDDSWVSGGAIPEAVEVDLGNDRLRPTRYAIKNTNGTYYSLKSWKFQVFDQAAADWIDLDVHTDDLTISGSYTWYSWPVTATEYYTRLRILATGPAQSGVSYFAFVEWELYGELKRLKS